MRLLTPLAITLLAAVHAFAVGSNTISTLATSSQVNELSYPIMGLDGTVYWSVVSPTGSSQLLGSGSVIATDPRTISEAGPYPIGQPVDVLGSTVLNAGHVFVGTGDGFLQADPEVFRASRV
jgi:hypothetical protein